MTEESNVSSILTQYLRHELPPTRMSEIQHLITTDTTWIKEYQSLLALTQGIRHTTLRDLQSTLKNLEKTITPSGDLSPTPTYIYESNETSGLESTPLTPRDGHGAPDNRLIQGIRYTSLQDELKKLQKIENTVKEQTEQNTKKNEIAPKGARVIGMKWWAIAAGVIFVILSKDLFNYIKYYTLQNTIQLPEQVFIKRNSKLTNIKEEAYFQYSKKKYKKATNNFEKIILLNNSTKEDEFYYALCLIKIYKFDQAKLILLNLKQQKELPYDINYFLNLLDKYYDKR